MSTQCGNFRIFLPLRFYVKSMLGISKVQKSPLTFLEALNFEFHTFLNFLRPEILPEKNSEHSKLQRMAVFKLLKRSKLISRKISMAGKF